jgi:hypothetical protein
MITLLRANTGESDVIVTSSLACCREGARRQTSTSTWQRVVVLHEPLGLLANLASISPGMNLGFSAVTLPAMQTANDTAAVTRRRGFMDRWSAVIRHADRRCTAGPWLVTMCTSCVAASLASIGTPVGCLLSGPMMRCWPWTCQAWPDGFSSPPRRQAPGS